jgi:hypothetical protein
MKYLLILAFIFCHLSYFFVFGIEINRPIFDNKFKKWKVFYIYEDESSKVCYMFSTPSDSTGNHSDSRNPYIMVSIFANNQKKEISISSGYRFKGKSIVSVGLDNSNVKFIAESDYIAWPLERDSDELIINKMLKSFKINIFSESMYGTYSVDTYSLEGFKNALDRLNVLCNNK